MYYMYQLVISLQASEVILLGPNAVGNKMQRLGIYDLVKRE